MKITDKINFREPKYMLPAILYLPLLGASYLIFDLFHTETVEIQDKTLQTTEFLNPDLPEAQIKGGDGIGSKYENMAKSWGKIQDYSAVDNIERDEPDKEKEEYESQYTQDDIALLDEQQQEKAAATQVADAKTREQEALAELEKALAQARLRGQNEVMSPAETDTAASAQMPAATIEVKGKIEEESRSVKAPSENEPPSEVVRKVKTASDYFNTLAKDSYEPKLIKAIIDENIKAVDGSRVRLRLLDDVEINECVVKRGSYLYATMSGFSSGRVKGNITSILIHDELVKVSLSLYDTDGMEGLHVPNSQFRETSKDVASGAVSGNMNMNTGTTGSSLAQWGMQAATNAYQKTSNAIGKAIKKNKVKLKYGTFVYLVNGRETNNGR
ncbi:MULTISPECIES: conjugative transposon protein TraM [Bacteroides]|jgi:conjugative transposon TraM protein|uniref:conjugative transposon protein TraM n=1 Tax=Bacteroides TaxID=816 RepID=UPI001C3C7CE5|nr:conjugative transposon protein TraM [Bacteroides acidifaciens]